MLKAILRSFAVIALLIAAALPVQADDEEKYAVLSDIFANVVDDEGHLTREMHEQYWSALAGVMDEGAPDYEGFWVLIDNKVNVATHRYIRAAAEQCLHALLEKETGFSAEYGNARAAFLALAESGEDAKKLKDAVDRWDSNVQKLGGKKYRPDKTTKANVVEALEIHLSTAEAALHRYGSLRRSTWEPTITTRKYRSMPVAVRWPGEFVLSFQKERKLKAGMLNHAVNATDHVKVIHYKMGKRSAKFYRSALRQMATGALRDYKISDAKPKKQKWRGLLSYTASGNGSFQDVPASVFARFIPSPDGNGVLGLFAIDLGSGADASGNFEKLQQAVQFD